MDVAEKVIEFFLVLVETGVGRKGKGTISSLQR